MSDLMMGGGAVLPEPEDTIYIFDEGHHLPDKAINHFASFLQIRSTQGWLEQIPGILHQLNEEFGNMGSLNIASFDDSVVNLMQRLEEVIILFEPLREFAEGNDTDMRYRFPGGQLELGHRDLARVLFQETGRLQGQLAILEDRLEEELEDESQKDIKMMNLLHEVLHEVFEKVLYSVYYQIRDEKQNAPYLSLIT